MKETLLIVLLVAAIVSDAVRIVQYRAMMRTTRSKAIRDMAYKYRRLWRRFFGIEESCPEEAMKGYADYCVEHWEP